MLLLRMFVNNLLRLCAALVVEKYLEKISVTEIITSKLPCKHFAYFSSSDYRVDHHSSNKLDSLRR